MAYFRVLALLVALFVLTAILCWAVVSVDLILSPILTLVLFCAGILGVLMTVEATI